MRGQWIRTAVVLSLVVAAALVASGRGEASGRGGGRLVMLQGHLVETTPGGDDIRPAERRAVERAVRQHVREHGWYRPDPDGALLRSAVPGSYPFFPMAGRFGRDVFQRNFLDMDPAFSAIQDFNCTSYTYDGHLGHDVTIRSFAEKDIGVPVYAARDGLVIRTDDGHYDENGGGTPDSTDANHVVIDHGSQQVAYYWHLKNGSVAVQAGDEVVAGQQIGLTASSGWSNWPHLHFETHVNGTAVEPSAGGCNPGPSGWVKQPRVVEKTYLSEFAFSHEGPSGDPQRTLPWDMTRTGQIALTDPILYFWFQVKSQPANAPWRALFRRPDGTIAGDESGAFKTPFARGAWWFFGFDVEDMHAITGTWTLEFFLAEQSLGVLPVEVVTKRKRRFNRPPAAVKLGFSPKRPRIGEVLSCLVTTDLLLDDPDYDVVRFDYEWTVNGEVVRAVQSAAHADVLPGNAFGKGDRVGCTVTPSDGREAGPTSSRVRRAK